MEKTAWLHIGTPKTGSSSLQRLMQHNRAKIEAQGVALLSEALPGTGSLERYAANDEHMRRPRIRKKQTDPATIGRFRRRLEKQLALTVSESAQRVWCFSDENLTFLHAESEFLRLKDLLEPHFDEVKIVVYIRAQHDRAISAYSQRLRMGKVTREVLRIPDESGSNEHSYFYDRFPENWVTHFGRDNVTVRIFDRAELQDGNVVADFFKIVGLSLAGIIPPGDKNLAFSTEQQAFLLHINKYLQPLADGGMNIARDDLLRAMQDMPRADKGVRPSKAQVQDFLAQFEDSNERVRQSWFPDRERLFRVDLSKFPDTPDELQMNKKQLSEMFAKVFSAYWAFMQKPDNEKPAATPAP